MANISPSGTALAVPDGAASTSHIAGHLPSGMMFGFTVARGHEAAR